MFLNVHSVRRFIPYTTKTRPGYVGGPVKCIDIPPEHTLVDGYVVDDPFEWCEKINAFAASEVRVCCITHHTRDVRDVCVLKRVFFAGKFKN